MAIKRIKYNLGAISEEAEAAYQVIRTLRDAGYDAYTVGGSVRDQLLEKNAKDVDVTTNALPDQVRALFSHTVAVGAAFGVMGVIINDIIYH